MKLIWLKYMAAAALTAMMAASCSDPVNKNDGWDDDLISEGAPSVRKITASADTTTVITTAALNQPIAIFGDNLTGLQSVRINDLELDLRDVYAKRHRLEMIVPRILPGEISNKLTITTELGSVTVPLEVVLPSLKIEGFKNEFAADRDTVQITGSDFDLYLIDSINAKANFNGQAIQMFACTDKSFSIVIPAGTPEDKVSFLSIETPNVKTPVQVPFRDPGIAILTNDDRTWKNAWFASGITEVKPDTEPKAPFFKWIVFIKKNFSGSWGYENVMITHFWLDDSAADLLANPDQWCVKMEINNPAGTPLAKYIRIGSLQSEAADKLFMWDPAQSNNGVALNTLGKWQTVTLDVKDLFPALEEGKTTCLKIAKKPYENYDELNDFKVAMQRELPGDVEFYFWNIRFVKKIATE